MESKSWVKVRRAEKTRRETPRGCVADSRHQCGVAASCRARFSTFWARTGANDRFGASPLKRLGGTARPGRGRFTGEKKKSLADVLYNVNG